MKDPRETLPPEALLQIGINRRQAIVRLATAAAATSAPAAALAAAPTVPAAPAAPVVAPAASGSLAKGSLDPRDPDLVNPVLLWKKILTADELATTAALCDVIIPADERSPAASQVAVPDFIDEWVSAPYPRQKADGLVVRGGLAWLNTESNRRFGKRFVALSLAQKTAICDDIAFEDTARARFKAGARFFDVMRSLTVLGFFTTLEGMKDLGYVGNTPMAEWKGPSAEVLRRLGVT
jgi:gluconate 2-dehydrogenase gamma chain